MTQMNAIAAPIVPSLGGASLGQDLIAFMEKRPSRTDFFSELSRQLKKLVYFDRLCINLYDAANDMVSLFTAPEGVVISSLSPVRAAEQNTVAGHVIRSRKPVAIMDLKHHFPGDYVPPMAEAGLGATMAFPLIVFDELLGTLHCSFAREPENSYRVMELLTEICPVVAACLALILFSERLELGEGRPLPGAGANGADVEESCVFASPVMLRLMREIADIARLDVPVLILGETGTGKSMLAQRLHSLSPRAAKNYIKVNCPALAPSLFESELFGHARGAFTGAVNKRAGRFELAHGGTLFLDEIGELSEEMQSKLLQVIEDQAFERVGESRAISVDVRLITATNVDVAAAVAEGRLRADLYYRIAPVVLLIPPLRERREDIVPLVRHFSEQLAARYGLPGLNLPRAAMDIMRAHSWPGNIRELRNVVNRLLIRGATGRGLTPNDVNEAVAVAVPEAPALTAPAAPPDALPAPTALPTLQDAERRHIMEALQRCNGVLAGRNGAARLLGMPRSTLQHRIRKLGIDERSFARRGA